MVQRFGELIGDNAKIPQRHLTPKPKSLCNLYITLYGYLNKMRVRKQVGKLVVAVP